MSNLQRTIEQQRALDSSGLTSVSPQSGTKALLVHIWQGESWAQPWVQFCGARLGEGGDDGTQQLDLVFTRYLVIVTGRNLRGLFEELAACRVSTLRELPADSQPPGDDGTPFIQRIEVRQSATASNSATPVSL